MNTDEKISQYGVIDIGISDNQIIYYTEKLMRIKSGIEQFITFRSFKNYSADIFERALTL